MEHRVAQGTRHRVYTHMQRLMQVDGPPGMPRLRVGAPPACSGATSKCSYVQVALERRGRGSYSAAASHVISNIASNIAGRCVPQACTRAVVWSREF
jgi:hypothetical protein